MSYYCLVRKLAAKENLRRVSPCQFSSFGFTLLNMSGWCPLWLWLESFTISSVFSLRSSVFGLQSSVFSLRSSVFGLQSSVFGLRSSVFSLQSSVLVYWNVRSLYHRFIRANWRKLRNFAALLMPWKHTHWRRVNSLRMMMIMMTPTWRDSVENSRYLETSVKIHPVNLWFYFLSDFHHLPLKYM